MALGKGLSSLIPTKTIRGMIHHETGSNGDVQRIWQIPTSEIAPNSHQPRKHFSHQELEELVLSIKEHGILQPILVRERADGGYELIAGERRLRAAVIAGLATVPALVRAATDQQKLEIALIENIQREDLNPLEEAFAFARLVEEFGMTQQAVADKVGKSRPAVANTIRLLELPDPIKKALMDGQLGMGKARAILSLKSEKEQIALFKSMMGERVTVRDVERAVEMKGAVSRKGSVRRDPNLHAQEELLEERLGTKVRITQKGERGIITIEYYSKDELKRIIKEFV